MLTIRPSKERGHFDHGWLDTYHTFSFADYHDPAHVHFRSLRVINEDRVAGGQGFGMHPHRDMEILTYILSGALEHRDSMGNGGVIRPGDVQRMSAGTGVFHSEVNPLADTPVHLLQIWIFPDRRNLPPSYEQTHYTEADRTNRLCLVASNDGRDGSTTIHQDASVYASLLSPDAKELTHPFAEGRGGFLQLAKGSLEVRTERNTLRLNAGDGLAIEQESWITLSAHAASDGLTQPAEFILFDLG